MMNIKQLYVNFHNHRVGVLSLAPDDKLCTFEYDKQWLIDGFSISPLELPLRTGLFMAKPTPFFGNFGIFEDSLPDGYGRYLLHKALLKEGIDDYRLSSLDRLSIVGCNGMGALTFEPVTQLVENVLIRDVDLCREDALAVLSGVQDIAVRVLLYNSGNSGGARPKTVFSDVDGHWLVKFRHTYDPMDMGVQEYRYNEVARKCGINVPDFKLVNGKYFASRRFDIADDGTRIHTATVGGLLCVSLSSPVLDYSNLLALSGFLTQNPKDVEQMYRRMLFNYFAENKDDHCKNFSFMVQRINDQWRWVLAPAYDLTFCNEGYNGEHATSVNGTGHPTINDFILVGTKIKMREQRCRELIDEIRDKCVELKDI